MKKHIILLVLFVLMISNIQNAFSQVIKFKLHELSGSGEATKVLPAITINDRTSFYRLPKTFFKIEVATTTVESKQSPYVTEEIGAPKKPRSLEKYEDTLKMYLKYPLRYFKENEKITEVDNVNIIQETTYDSSLLVSVYYNARPLFSKISFTMEKQNGGLITGGEAKRSSQAGAIILGILNAAVSAAFAPGATAKRPTNFVNDIHSYNQYYKIYLDLINGPQTDARERLNEIKLILNYYSERLGGEKTSETKTYTYYYYPSFTTDKRDLVTGLTLNNNSILGNNVIGITLNLGSGVDILSKLTSKGKFLPSGSEPGFIYREAARCLLKVEVKNGVDEKLKIVKNVDVFQLGYITALPALKGYRKNQTYKFDPATGTLSSFSISNNGISDGERDALLKLSETTIKKFEKPTEAARLTDVNTLLEAQIKKMELQKKYDSLRLVLGGQNE